MGRLGIYVSRQSRRRMRLAIEPNVTGRCETERREGHFSKPCTVMTRRHARPGAFENEAQRHDGPQMAPAIGIGPWTGR
jgi:hypothetical protein